MPVDLIETPAPRAPFTLKGWHVLSMFLGFFAVVFAVNGFMMTVALQTMPGADVKSAYEASQKFNASAALSREIAALGFTGNAHIGPEGAVIDMTGPDGKPAGSLTLALHLSHPSDLSRDLDITFLETGPGHYVSQTGLPVGSWHVAIEAQRNASIVFRSENRMIISETK